MASFDIVSRVDIAELDNAINGAAREVKQRYDLKGTMCSIERSGYNLTINADNDMLLRQMHQLLRSYCARRGVDNQMLDFKAPHNATKGSLRQDVIIRQGIDESTSKQIIKVVKASKIKVQVTLQGNELRVSGKKRDELQEVIKVVKDMEVDVPLQYINLRE
jgi:uncharacterized protein YajQ (UPF0234 family)